MKVKVREARAADKAPLMEFVSKTWGGHDYIPDIWDEWIRDKSGKIFVVVADGRQVGMNRVRLLPEGVGWLEGARIHPQFRGKGLASLLGASSMKFGSARGTHVFRLTSGSRNKAAHRQIAKMGFGEIARFNVHRVKRTGLKPNPSVQGAKLGELNPTWRFIRSSSEFKVGKGLYWDSFVARTLNKENLAELIKDRRVFHSIDNGGSKAVAIFGRVTEGSEVWNQMGFLSGASAYCRKLVSHLFTGAIAKQADENFIFLPRGSNLPKIMNQLGIKKSFQMVVFEGRSR